ncbi:MAG: MarR family transcriptional regulator [Planctomycetota bacterium]
MNSSPQEKAPEGQPERQPEAPREKPVAGRTMFVELLKTHERLQSEFALLFKQHKLTLAQFNVLRILRGAGPQGLACQEIGERLINRLPDVTRLLDRMEAARLVSRERSSEDRRVVTVKLTAEGRRRVDALDEPVLALHEQQVAHLSVREVEELASALERLRTRPEG